LEIEFDADEEANTLDLNADTEVGTQTAASKGYSLRELPPGTKVGKYNLGDGLGITRNSVVYKGYGPKDEIVAIKIYPLERDPDKAESLEARFWFECETLQRLDHPNIVKFRGDGTWEGRHYFAMEYVPGETLRTHIQNMALTPYRSLEIITEVADALREVHGEGILHRDVKPANILITPEGKVKLIDFNISINEAEANEYEGQGLFGSLAYMPPEQAEEKTIDERADQYALGRTWLSCLRLEIPKGTAEEMYNWKLDFLPSSINPEHIPTTWDPIIKNMVQRNRDLRYQSMALVVGFLRKLQVRQRPYNPIASLDDLKRPLEHDLHEV